MLYQRTACYNALERPADALSNIQIRHCFDREIHKDNQFKAKPHRIMHYSTYTLPKKAQSFTSPKIKVKK
jgi:hypothetical protein